MRTILTLSVFFLYQVKIVAKSIVTYSQSVERSDLFINLAVWP